ncbi:hypothetical protein [Pseudomonas sp. IzPS59]|uniref:hypothetical protein n=1 Tax=Pseudomonas sp. IzPS59 TaxID=2774459 RepID=UPI001787E3FD|nr:hypothetical protein [Pseudomonas sp. IzPS59]
MYFNDTQSSALELKPNEPFICLHQGKLREDLIFIALAKDAFILAPSNSPSKVKPYAMNQTVLLIKINAQKIFDAYNSPKGTEYSVGFTGPTTRSRPFFQQAIEDDNFFGHKWGHTNTTNWEEENFQISTIQGTQSIGGLPPDRRHPTNPVCWCSRCNGNPIGGWARIEPVTNPTSDLQTYRDSLTSIGISW